MLPNQNPVHALLQKAFIKNEICKVTHIVGLENEVVSIGIITNFMAEGIVLLTFSLPENPEANVIFSSIAIYEDTIVTVCSPAVISQTLLKTVNHYLDTLGNFAKTLPKAIDTSEVELEDIQVELKLEEIEIGHQQQIIEKILSDYEDDSVYLPDVLLEEFKETFFSRLKYLFTGKKKIVKLKKELIDKK